MFVMALKHMEYGFLRDGGGAKAPTMSKSTLDCTLTTCAKS